VGGEHRPDHILVDVNARCLIDLLSDPRSTEPGIASLQFNDGLYELTQRTLGARLSAPARRIQLSILSLLEQAMKFQQRSRLDNHSSPLDAAWIEKQ
jgi:hypothetical protein